MKSILFHLGPFPVYSFGVMVAAGVLLSLYLMSRTSKKTGFPSEDQTLDMVFTGVFSGFVGARFYYILQEWPSYQNDWLKIFAIWEGGLIFYGGVIGALLGLGIFFRIKKIPFLRGLDFIITYVPLAHAFGRLGCFLNGCCHGSACDLPWAISVPDVSYKVHPTQLYEAFLNLILFFFLHRRYSHKRFDGEISLFYFMFYSAGRFAIEFWRDNLIWGLLSINQWISVIIFSFALIFYLQKRRSSSHV